MSDNLASAKNIQNNSWECFYEPGFTKLTWNLYKWFKYIIRPQVASVWIVIVSMITITVLINGKVDNPNNCPDIQKYNEWQSSESNAPLLGNLFGFGETKEFTYYSGNKTVVVNNECIYPDFREPYFKTVYSVIQSTMVFMLVMTLSSGLSKYREEIRLFEALTGDIKAMAMLATHLSYDGQKYDLDKNNNLKYRMNVEEQFDKIKLLLAVLAPSARMVLKGNKDEIRQGDRVVSIPYATPERLETVKNYRKIMSYEPRLYPLYPFWCCGRKYKDGYRKYCFDFFNMGCISENKCTRCFQCLQCFGVTRKYKRVEMKWSDYKKWQLLQEVIAKKKYHGYNTTADEPPFININDFKEKTFEKKIFGKIFSMKGSKLLDDLGFHKLQENSDLTKNIWDVFSFERKFKIEKGILPTLNKQEREEILKPFDKERKIPTKREYVMYKKIKALGDQTGMDLFECVMTVLLDETMKISENNLGFGNDEGSAVMSAIYTKWEQIYGSWGAMSSIKGFAEPILVHLYRCLMLLAYAFMMPYSYIDMISFGEDDANVLFWCVFLTFIDISIFAMMWYIAYEIRNPFVDVRCMNGVKPISAQTQKQVVNLIKYQKDYEELDYRGIRDANMKEAEIFEGKLKANYGSFKPSEETLTEILNVLKDTISKTDLASILASGLNIKELKQKIESELNLNERQRKELDEILRPKPPRPRNGPIIPKGPKIGGYQARGLRRRPLMF